MDQAKTGYGFEDDIQGEDENTSDEEYIPKVSEDSSSSSYNSFYDSAFEGSEDEEGTKIVSKKKGPIGLTL